ncbi:hypothetical protein [Phenylobacterium aquaticum]|uniref:hypothetical protein n=1 Tax=Phenylobacterium aquaticum TaxID=1763816 RepID=UPI0026EABEBB|nr:hypothetical protein [Phenylobacterium aquaticum]
MGVVIDFIELVLGRRRSQVPGPRTRMPFAVFDEAAFGASLAHLDLAKATDVLLLGGQFAATCLPYGDDRRTAARLAMQAHPDAAWILCFDSDGYIREAALRRLNSPAETTGRLVALTLRLNDWVPQVRQQAVEAFRRVWPLTPPGVIAGAVPYLLRQRFIWRRWTHEGNCIDELLGDASVAAEVILLLLHGRSGSLGRTLAQALRFPVYDPALAKLALEARLPDVRATAMKTIMQGEAVWPIGHGWAWIDKTMGVRRRITLTERRSVSAPEPPDLLKAGIADRSALVRKVAAAVAVERMNNIPDITEIVAVLANDRSAAVRDRADYIRRHLGSPKGLAGS